MPGPGEVAALHERTDYVWHLYTPDVRPGAWYGYRVEGPYAPAEGHRFNPDKLLVDPYAKAMSGRLVWDDAVFGYTMADPESPVRDDRDDAAYVPKGLVIDGAFSWGDDRRPGRRGPKAPVGHSHRRPVRHRPHGDGPRGPRRPGGRP